MPLRPKDENGQYQNSEAGNIASLADILFTEYALSGYSLTPDEVTTALIADFKLYAGWASTYTQDQGLTTEVDGTQILSFAEWGILEPVIRAHCELIQANRMEGTGSLGGERFGLSVSEASPMYAEAKEKMKSDSFVEEAFFIPCGG